MNSRKSAAPEARSAGSTVSAAVAVCISMPYWRQTPSCLSVQAHLEHADLLRRHSEEGLELRRFTTATDGPQQNGRNEPRPMQTFSAVIERCPETGFLVGHVPGFPGAHSQGETLDELQANLQEVIAMLLEDGEPTLESNFVGLQLITVPA